MALFAYKAVNAEGTIQEGTKDAKDEAAILRFLQAESMVPIHVSQSGLKSAYLFSFNKNKEGLSQKDIVLFLHKDSCGYCEKMLFQLEEEEITQAIKENFILVDINRDDDESISYKDFNGTNHQFLKALEVDFYPTIVFISGYTNKIIYNISGYRNSKKIITVLKYISSESYKKLTLEEFKDEIFINQ